MALHAPVLVLKDSLKRESGAKVHQANIQAAKAVTDIIRTTLGPRAMLKMLLDAGGGIVVTNDGNAILREIDIAHPAAKSMIELSRTQDEEVGDGTTSVIVLAGEMLHVAQAFIDKNYHPTVICRAYTKALDDAIAVLDKIAMPVDVNDRGAMLGLVKSSIGTKFTGQFGDLIAVINGHKDCSSIGAGVLTEANKHFKYVGHMPWNTVTPNISVFRMRLRNRPGGSRSY